MSPGEAIKSSLSKFATFSGRASASEFWWSYAAYTVLRYVAFIVHPWVGLFAWAAFVLPVNAAAVRRMNDQGKSGWVIVFMGIAIAVTGIYRPSLGDLDHTNLQEVSVTLLYFAFLILGFFLLIGESLRPSEQQTPNHNEVPK